MLETLVKSACSNGIITNVNSAYYEYFDALAEYAVFGNLYCYKFFFWNKILRFHQF